MILLDEAPQGERCHYPDKATCRAARRAAIDVTFAILVGPGMHDVPPVCQDHFPRSGL